VKYTWTVYYAVGGRTGEVTVPADTIEAAIKAARTLVPNMVIRTIGLDKELSKPRLDPATE
jgi:hypothetical protein